MPAATRASPWTNLPLKLGVGAAACDQPRPAQLGQDLGVNLVLPERRLIALQPQLPQPSRDIHKRPMGMVIACQSCQSDKSKANNPSTATTLDPSVPYIFTAAVGQVLPSRLPGHYVCC
jgi:hypothetical protein